MNRAQSAVAVEYIYCISVEGKTSPHECLGYNTKLHLMVDSSVEYPFIAITLKSTLTQSGSTCRVPSMGHIELFNPLL